MASLTAKEARSIAYLALARLNPLVTSEVLATGNAAVTPFVATIPIDDGTTNRVSVVMRGNTAGGALDYLYEAQLIVKRLAGFITVETEINAAGAGVPVVDNIGITGITYVGGAVAFITVEFAGKLATNISSQFDAWVDSKAFL